MRTFGHQARVISRVKILGDVLMTLRASFAAHESRAFDVRRDDDGAFDGRARDHRRSGSNSEQTNQRGHARKFPLRWWWQVGGVHS